MKNNYKHLNCEERILIQLSLEKGCTIRAIARSFDRSASSVSRQLAQANLWPHLRLAMQNITTDQVSFSHTAQVLSALAPTS